MVPFLVARRGLATGTFAADAARDVFCAATVVGAAAAGAAAGCATSAFAACFISAFCLRRRSTVRSSLTICASSSALLSFGAVGAALRATACFAVGLVLVFIAAERDVVAVRALVDTALFRRRLSIRS